MADGSILRKLTICVDFDGTICEYAFPKCGPPRWEAIQALRDLHQRGWTIVIHSSRVNAYWPSEDRRRRTAEMIEYLLGHGVPFDHIWGAEVAIYSSDEGTCGYDLHFLDRDVGKPVAHVYLDDRALPVAPRVGSQVWPAYAEHEIVSACIEMAKSAESAYLRGAD